MPDNRTPLYGAIGDEQRVVAEFLYAHGAKINTADGEMGTFLTPLVYRFAAEQEYRKRETTRSSDYLQRADSAFVAAEQMLNERAKLFSH